MGKKKLLLSEEQRKIVELVNSRHLVLAPPGTGKTELLAERVNAALSEGGDPAKMICLTFTNRAAKSMKTRIAEKHEVKGLFIGNVHHYCSNFLFSNRLIPQMTSLIDEEDSEQLLNEAKSMENYSQKVFSGDLLRLNTWLKQQKMGFPEHLLLPPGKEIPSAKHAVKVCERYESLKNESMLLDFDDLLTLTYLNLASDNHKSGVKYTWLQVDEVQDLNPLQWEIINLICTPDAHKVFFGDYEQAIFSFMGAKLERLHTIEKECQVHNLQRNFRSPGYLLQVLVDFAREHLNPKWKKDPIPDKSLHTPSNALMMINIEGTNTDEAEYIAENILPSIPHQEGAQTAILVRTNATAELYSKLLKSENIDHFKISGFDIFRRKLIKDIFAYLGCLEHNLDKLSWYRIFNIFGKIPTLKESRKFVNLLFEAGFYPADFLYDEVDGSGSVLKNFENTVKHGRVVVFDTETTGLDVYNDDIIQIAAVEIVKGKIGKTFDIYLKTDKSLAITEHIHNISGSFLKEKGMPAHDGLVKFKEFAGGDTVVAHNLGYDRNILKYNFSRNNIDFTELDSAGRFDSIDITRRMYPKLHTYRLEELISNFGLQGENTHNAMDDVLATANLVLFLSERLNERINEQTNFIKNNEKILKDFQERFSPLWRSYHENKKVPMIFSEFIYSFIDMVKKYENYKFEDEDQYYLTKLVRHMDAVCERKPLRSLLKQHMPDYRRYKESDLVLGDEKIIISTVHKAKGLEFENVIIPECVNDVYPFWASKSRMDIQEDARTLYVALSRARKRLVISTHTLSINRFGRTFQREPSIFLNSINKHFLE